MAKRKRKITIDRNELKLVLQQWAEDNVKGDVKLESFEVHRNGGIELLIHVGVDESLPLEEDKTE